LDVKRRATVAAEDSRDFVPGIGFGQVALRYYYQGIGRFSPTAAYARGLADLRVLANLVPTHDYLFGPTPTSVDAAIYGFIANIYFYPIETPLRQFVSSRANLVRHCTAIHAAVGACE